MDSPSFSSPVIIQTLSTDVGFPAGYYRLDAITDGSGSPDTVYTTDDLDGPWYTRLEANADNNELTDMPIALVRTGANAFTLQVISYNKRLSGGEDTNPSPSFVGERITDLCIFQDRLWLAHETGVVSSQAGDLFNFWVDDYTNVVDSDPIALVMPGPSAAQPDWLVPLDDRIVMFATGGNQYEITTRDFFTPSSTNLQPTTRYQCSKDVRPLITGQQVVFLEDKNTTSSLWEYFYDFGSDANLSIESSIQCQGYLPDSPSVLTGSQSNGLMFMMSPDSQDIFVYHYYWNINEKIQSAFSKWTMYANDSTAKILGISANEQSLYVILDRMGKVWLERIDIQHPWVTPNLDFSLCLDQQRPTNPSYDAVSNTTTWTLLDMVEDELDENDYVIVLHDDWDDATQDPPQRQSGTVVVPDSVTTVGSNTVLTVAGQWQDWNVDGSGNPVGTQGTIVGVKYNMSSKMSQPMVRDESGQTIQGNFQIRTMEVRHQDTTDYEVVVTPANRDSKTFPYYAGRVGSARVGQLARADYGRFNVRVFGNSQDTDIVIQSDSPYPVLLTKLEYIGDFVPQRTNPVKT